jgi:iron complex transport system substrate-binding protein
MQILALLFLALLPSISYSAYAAGDSSDGYPRKIVDSLGRDVTVDKPVERIIALGNYRTEAVKVLGDSDKLVGIDTDSQKNKYYFSDLTDLPQVGTWSEPDIEKIAELKPDLVITSANVARIKALNDSLSRLGIAVAGMDFYRDNLINSEVEKLGYLLDKEDRAKEYINWRDGYVNKIRDYVSGLKDSEKPTVYMEWGGHSNEPGKSYGNGSSGQAMCDFTGARNIAATLEEFPTVESEWVIVQNPDYIIKYVNLAGKWGWNSTKEAEVEADLLANRTGWNNITAVKDGSVYILSSEIAWGLDSIVLGAYMSKWFHPDLNIDPEKVYKEYLDRFLNVKYPDGTVITYKK